MSHVAADHILFQFDFRLSFRRIEIETETWRCRGDTVTAMII